MYMGVALTNLGRKDDACKAFRELDDVYGNKAPQDVRDDAAAAKTKAGCCSRGGRALRCRPRGGGGRRLAAAALWRRRIRRSRPHGLAVADGAIGRASWRGRVWT